MGIIKWVKNLSENTLYFPGCLTKTYMKEEFENYKKIFDKLDIAYILLTEEEVCCGFNAYMGGYKKQVKKWAEKNYELFKKNSVKKIITNSSHAYHMFKKIYPELLREFDIEVEHASVTINGALRKKGITFKGNEEDRKDIIYHDACYLGRYSQIYDEPRDIIERLGGRVKEFSKNKDFATCSGSCGGLPLNYPELSRKIASKRINDAPDNTTEIVSACITEHANLRSVTDRSIEISSFIMHKLEVLGL